MGEYHRERDKMEETAAESQDSGKCAGFEKVKNTIADKIREAAKSLKEKATASDEPRYKNQASEWLDQSAEYVRQFDFEKANARVREYVGRSPGVSILIAGGIGLVIGAILRRR